MSQIQKDKYCTFFSYVEYIYDMKLEDILYWQRMYTKRLGKGKQEMVMGGMTNTMFSIMCDIWNIYIYILHESRSKTIREKKGTVRDKYGQNIMIYICVM